MLGLGMSKILGGAALVAGIAALILWGLLNSEKVKSRELQNRLELSLANTEILKGELKDNSEQLKALIALQAKNMEMLNGQQDKIDKIESARNDALAENHQMRLEERFKALQNPFKRGGAASGRVRDLMRGIAGRGSDRGSKDTSPPKADTAE